jgi:Ser/Thr protein kinase RdoA (MazF antagonist)
MRLPEKYSFVRDIVSKLWAGAPGSVKLVRESANVVFRFEAGGVGRYLRITNVWQRKKVVSAMDYLRFLHGQGAPVCAPIASVNGRFIEDYQHDNSTYMCRTYEEVPGEVLTNRCTDPIIYEAWGKAIAQLHQAASRYQPHPDLYFWSHDQEVQETLEFLPPHDELGWREYEQVMDWLNNMPPIDGGFGVTHGDCNAGNFIWNGEAIRIIDFDEPMWEWFAADVARPFKEITDFPLALRRELMAALVKGYRGIRPLSDLTVASLPWFIRFKSLSAYAWDLGDNGTTYDDPDMVSYRELFANPIEW